MKVEAKTISKIPSFPAVKFKQQFPVRIEIPATRILSPIQINKLTIKKFTLEARKQGFFGTPLGEKKATLYSAEVNVSGPMHSLSELTLVDANGNQLQTMYVDPGLSVTFDYRVFLDTIEDMAEIIYKYSAEIKHVVPSPTDKLPDFVFSAILPVEQKRTLFIIDEDTLDKPEFMWDNFERFWKTKLLYYIDNIQTIGFNTYSGSSIPEPKPKGDIIYTMMFNEDEHAFCFEATTNYSEAGMYSNKVIIDLKKGSTGTSKVYTIMLFRLLKEPDVNAYLYVGFDEKTYIGKYTDPNTGNEVDAYLKYSRELNVSSGGSLLGVWGVPDQIRVNLRWDGNGTPPCVALEFIGFLMLE